MCCDLLSPVGQVNDVPQPRGDPPPTTSSSIRLILGWGQANCARSGPTRFAPLFSEPQPTHSTQRGPGGLISLFVCQKQNHMRKRAAYNGKPGTWLERDHPRAELEPDGPEPRSCLCIDLETLQDHSLGPGSNWRWIPPAATDGRGLENSGITGRTLPGGVTAAPLRRPHHT